MTERRSSVTPYRALLFCATVWWLTQILFLVDSNFSRAKQFQESDYIMTFYVAGHLVASGKASELYPEAKASSFVGASFDKAAHALLESLPEKTTAIYMYSPLLAWLFVPLSYLGPNLSLLVWHVISLFALVVSCKLLAQTVEVDFTESLLLLSLYMPIFITLWSGQLGLVLGLLPLSMGYFLLLHARPFAAGVVWSLLILKPQYFPAAALVALVATQERNFWIGLGMITGFSAILGANWLLFSPALVNQWLASHRLSDSLFTHPQYGIPVHLITSLPADILLLLPSNIRSAMKWPVYFVSLLLWGIVLACCWRFNRGQCEQRAKISLTLAVGCVLSSIALPHLLYYDLCVLIPAGFVLVATNRVIPKMHNSRGLALLAWTSISIYVPLFLLFMPRLGMALLLEIILLVCLIGLLLRINCATRQPNAV